MSRKEKENYEGRRISPYINKGEGNTLAQTSREYPPLQSCGVKMLMGIRGIIGSTRLHNLAASSTLVFNSKSSIARLVGILDRMGIKFASKFIGALEVKSQSSIELSHRHVTEPWSSAKRATARRRSLDRILVAAVE
eukprot:1161055-Pelagomonas_calceolata.AAC.2